MIFVVRLRVERKKKRCSDNIAHIFAHIAVEMVRTVSAKHQQWSYDNNGCWGRNIYNCNTNRFSHRDDLDQMHSNDSKSENSKPPTTALDLLCYECTIPFARLSYSIQSVFVAFFFPLRVRNNLTRLDHITVRTCFRWQYDLCRIAMKKMYILL